MRTLLSLKCSEVIASYISHVILADEIWGVSLSYPVYETKRPFQEIIIDIHLRDILGSYKGR